MQYSGQPTGPGGSRLVGFPGTAPSTVTSQVHILLFIVLIIKYIVFVSEQKKLTAWLYKKSGSA